MMIILFLMMLNSLVIQNVLDSAGVSKKEITDNLKTQHFDKRVVEELEEYKSKL